MKKLFASKLISFFSLILFIINISTFGVVSKVAEKEIYLE